MIIANKSRKTMFMGRHRKKALLTENYIRKLSKYLKLKYSSCLNFLTNVDLNHSCNIIDLSDLGLVVHSHSQI